MSESALKTGGPVTRAELLQLVVSERQGLLETAYAEIPKEFLGTSKQRITQFIENKLRIVTEKIEELAPEVSNSCNDLKPLETMLDRHMAGNTVRNVATVTSNIVRKKYIEFFKKIRDRLQKLEQSPDKESRLPTTEATACITCIEVSEQFGQGARNCLGTLEKKHLQPSLCTKEQQQALVALLRGKLESVTWSEGDPDGRFHFAHGVPETGIHMIVQHPENAARAPRIGIFADIDVAKNRGLWVQPFPMQQNIAGLEFLLQLLMLCSDDEVTSTGLSKVHAFDLLVCTLSTEDAPKKCKGVLDHMKIEDFSQLAETLKDIPKAIALYAELSNTLFGSQPMHPSDAVSRADILQSLCRNVIAPAVGNVDPRTFDNFAIATAWAKQAADLASDTCENGEAKMTLDETAKTHESGLLKLVNAHTGYSYTAKAKSSWAPQIALLDKIKDAHVQFAILHNESVGPTDDCLPEKNQWVICVPTKVDGNQNALARMQSYTLKMPDESIRNSRNYICLRRIPMTEEWAVVCLSSYMFAQDDCETNHGGTTESYATYFDPGGKRRQGLENMKMLSAFILSKGAITGAMDQEIARVKIGSAEEFLSIIRARPGEFLTMMKAFDSCITTTKPRSNIEAGIRVSLYVQMMITQLSARFGVVPVERQESFSREAGTAMDAITDLLVKQLGQTEEGKALDKLSAGIDLEIEKIEQYWSKHCTDTEIPFLEEILEKVMLDFHHPILDDVTPENRGGLVFCGHISTSAHLWLDECRRPLSPEREALLKKLQTLCDALKGINSLYCN